MDKYQEGLTKYCKMEPRKVLVGDVCQYVNGVWYRRSFMAEASVDDAIGVLSTRNLFTQDGTIDFSNVKYILKQAPIKEEQFLKKNDILICKEGALNHIGKVAYIHDDLPFVIGGTLSLLRVNRDIIDSRYLYYALASDLFMTYMADCVNSGSTICRVNADAIKSFELPLPTMEEQHKIIHALERYENRLKKEKDNIEKLSKLSVSEFLESEFSKDEDYYFDVMPPKSDDLKGTPYMGDQKYIFASYSHINTKSVIEIIATLQKEGFRIWYDEGIDPGTEWDEFIAEKIEKCDYFIAFMSREYMDSKNCKDELNYARDLDKERLLIYLEDVKLTGGMAMRLNRLQAIHKYTYSSFDDFIKKIESTTALKEFRN